MKIIKFLLTLMMIAGCSVIMVSCAPEACFEETNAYLKASFYINAKLVAPDSLTAFGFGQTTKIYDKVKDIQPALLPLNSSAGSCTYVIRINGVNDTMQFLYSSYPHLISKECGYTFYHSLDSFSFTQNNIDTILIINRSITTANEENVRIFY